MKLNEAIKEIESSKEFKNWVKNEDKPFLSNIFTIIEDISQVIIWQLDYYSPKKRTLTSFTKEKDKIIIKKDQEIFSIGDKIKELDLSNLKITVEESIKKVKENNPDEKATKIIALLQNKGPLAWNITFITSGFKVLNSRVNAETGEILSNEMKSILDFNTK